MAGFNLRALYALFASLSLLHVLCAADAVVSHDCTKYM
jgi:hypothetical protein